MRRLPLLLLFALAACGSKPAEPVPSPTPTVAVAVDVAPGELPAALTVGDWASYAAPEKEEWAVAPLDDLRWAIVAAELACVDRAHQGDPDAQTAGSKRVLAHHGTTAAAVMDYGIAVNGDAEKATRLGELVATAAESCS